MSSAKEAAPWMSDPAHRILAACVGFLADSYDLFAIDLVVAMLEFVYGEQVIGAEEKSLIVTTMLVGVIVGQIVFGVVADWMGRRRAFVVCAALTLVGAISGACVRNRDNGSLPAKLAVCRFFLGLGVGGEYPLAATVAAETTWEGVTRGRVVALVISMQGFGMLLSSASAGLVLAAGVELDMAWRIVLVIGAFPSFLALSLRWGLEESVVFERARQREEELEATMPRKSGSNLVAFSVFFFPLVGTALPWFLMNMLAYSFGSFKSSILNDLMHNEGLSERSQMVNDAWYGILVSLFAIAGFGTANAMIGHVSWVTMQAGGYIALATVFTVTALLQESSAAHSGALFLAALGAIFFLINAGPHVSTFVLPVEVYPTRWRATLHGFSAACGKLGAVVGTCTLPLAERDLGMGGVYWCCGFVAVAGALVTSLCTPRHPVDSTVLQDFGAASGKWANAAGTQATYGSQSRTA